MPRPFATTIDCFDDPNWEPLERVSLLARQSPDLPSFHPGEFMYMCRLAAPRQVRIHLYKHYDLRRYINLDDDGHAYQFLGSVPDCPDDSGGLYRRHRSLVDAIDDLELELFEMRPPYLRSFPPEDWPDDPVTTKPAQRPLGPVL